MRRTLLETAPRTIQRPEASGVSGVGRSHGAPIARGFALIAAGSLAFNVFFIFLPVHLASTSGVRPGPALLATVTTLCLAAGSAGARSVV